MRSGLSPTSAWPTISLNSSILLYTSPPDIQPQVFMACPALVLSPLLYAAAAHPPRETQQRRSAAPMGGFDIPVPHCFSGVMTLVRKGTAAAMQCLCVTHASACCNCLLQASPPVPLRWQKFRWCPALVVGHVRRRARTWTAGGAFWDCPTQPAGLPTEAACFTFPPAASQPARVAGQLGGHVPQPLAHRTLKRSPGPPRLKPGQPPSH